MSLDGDGEVTARLPLAREPDWQVETEWKTHQFWWAADGGSSMANCDPLTNADHNCDLPSRSMTQLTDQTNDTDPAGVEPGNLTTLGDLTGGTIVAIDTLQGHYVYRRTITDHNVSAGRVTVDRVCEHDAGNPGLGWGQTLSRRAALSAGYPGDTGTPTPGVMPSSPGNPAEQILKYRAWKMASACATVPTLPWTADHRIYNHAVRSQLAP
jgi:hypothetical protein